MKKDKKCVDAYIKMIIEESMPWDNDEEKEEEIQEEEPTDTQREEEKPKEKPQWKRINGDEVTKDIKNRIKKYDPRLDRVEFWFLEDGNNHSLVTYHKHTTINKEDIRRITSSQYFIELDAASGFIKFKFYDDQGLLLSEEDNNNE